jgi:hypothetical protein
MKIHSLAAQHPFVNRVIFVAFNRNISLCIPGDNNTATHTAIAAGCFRTWRLVRMR